MFSKTTNSGSGRNPVPTQPVATTVNQPSSASSASVRQNARAASVIGPDLVFEGSISGDGELLVDGAVKGDIHVSRLVIGEHAHVEGTVRGGAVEVRGRVIGNVEGKAVRLMESAHVEGDITHEQLSIDVGAFFQGRCAQFRPQAVAAQPVQAEVIPLDVHQG